MMQKEVERIVRMRMLSQQLAQPIFGRAEELVEWMGMMQAQDISMLPWAVGIRLRRPSRRAFAEAISEGRLVRMHLFRTTWQLVCAKDVRWMLSLCAERNRRAIDGYLAYSGEQLSEAQYVEGEMLLLDVLADGRSHSASELAAAFERKGHAYSAHQVSIILRRAETDGLVCSGDWRDRENTYALLSVKIPDTEPLPPRATCVQMLAERYFRSHGPATLQDFLWWTGLSKREAEAAIAPLPLACLSLRPSRKEPAETYFYMEQARTRTGQPCVHLLPSYDEFLIGYKSRHLVLEPDYKHLAHNNTGIFHPVILAQGHVVGNWAPRNMKPTFFSEQHVCPTDLLDDAISRRARFMGK